MQGEDFMVSEINGVTMSLQCVLPAQARLHNRGAGVVITGPEGKIEKPNQKSDTSCNSHEPDYRPSRLSREGCRSHHLLTSRKTRTRRCLRRPDPSGSNPYGRGRTSSK